MRPYEGPQVDPTSGHPLRADAKRRIMWENIKFQVFRLSNGTILQARSEIEAGAYENKGAELVDTVYYDEGIEFDHDRYQEPGQQGR